MKTSRKARRERIALIRMILACVCFMPVPIVLAALLGMHLSGFVWR